MMSRKHPSCANLKGASSHVTFSHQHVCRSMQKRNGTTNSKTSVISVLNTYTIICKFGNRFGNGSTRVLILLQTLLFTFVMNILSIRPKLKLNGATLSILKKSKYYKIHGLLIVNSIIK